MSEDIQATEMKVLNELVAVRLDVNIWSARRKLTAADLGGAELPPEELASLGSKRVCDPRDLRVFATLKSRAVSLLEKIGVRFLGGWALPETRMEEALRALKEIRAQFMDEKEKFLARYDEAVQDWIRNNPGWESIIANSVVSSQYVSQRLGFTWQTYRVVPAMADASAGLTCEVRRLSGTLYEEVSKVANEVWEKSFVGKTEVTHKALSPLRMLRSKLEGMSFVEPRVAPIVELLDECILAMPPRGVIRGKALLLLQGTMCLLRDPLAMVAHGQKIIEGQSAQSVFHGLAEPVQNVIAAENARKEELQKESEAVPPSQGMKSQTIDSFGLW